MSELGEVFCLDETEATYSTDDEASTEDDGSQEKEIKLSPTSIYSLREDQLEELKTDLKTKKFEEIKLNKKLNKYGFHVQLFTKTKESKCNLAQVMKSFIRNKDKYVKSYGREIFILIAEKCDGSLKSGFAICTDTAHHTVIPYVDTAFAYSVSQKILNPQSVGQLKCRYLNGHTVWAKKLFHKDDMISNLPTIASDSFFITEGFQAQIKQLPDSGLSFLSQLRSSITVTRFSLKILKSLYMRDMLRFMKELLDVHVSDKYLDAEEFECLTYVKPVKTLDLRKELDDHLKNNILKDIKVLRNDFFLCHNKYEQWVKCEKVELLQKTESGKDNIRTWDSRPAISDILDALGEENRDWSSLQIRYKSKGKWWLDKFLNYIHGHILYEKKYYFHIGKDWFEVDVEYLRIMDYVFFQLLKDKLLLEKDKGYLPLPWCSEKHSNEQINAEHCITFCRGVLHKELSNDEITQINSICFTNNQTSEQGRLPHLQDNEEMRGSLSAGNKSDNANKENNPPLPDSNDPVGKSVTERKQFSKREESRKKYVSEVTSPLSKIIGVVECQLCLGSLMSGDEEKYNKMYYMQLNQFLDKNPLSALNEMLGVDPDRKFPTFLHGDRILVENVELFDILKITKDKLYLYHVKEGVGQKTRDVASQIRISAHFIFSALYTEQNQNILGKWYEQITDYKEMDQTRLKLKEDLAKQNCSKQEFLCLFQERKIVYVYAFLDDAKGRKPFNELVSDEQCILRKEDFNKALNLMPPETLKDKIDVLCESLISDGILSEKDDEFSVERKFLYSNTKKILQIFKIGGFSDTQADLLFKTLEKHFVPTVSLKSHIAKFELIRLAHDFKSSYPDFELKFCQIKKP